MHRVLVVYKKSQLELYQEHEPSALQRIREREPELHARFRLAHDENARSIEVVRTTIEARDLEARFVYRADHESADGCDFVIAVGGDGTLLDVSHCVFRRPLLGVNSSQFSVGHYCATRPQGLGAMLDALARGELSTTTVTRLRATIGGRAIDIPILNELLFAATVPAAVSRYLLTVDGVTEEHKSSGIWVATATGSTAAIRSAGGQVMVPGDHRIQYVVREPYRWSGGQYALGKGVIEGPLQLCSKMRTAAVYLDGHREQHLIELGDRIAVDQHPHPLQLLGFRHDQS